MFTAMQLIHPMCDTRIRLQRSRNDVVEKQL